MKSQTWHPNFSLGTVTSIVMGWGAERGKKEVQKIYANPFQHFLPSLLFKISWLVSFTPICFFSYSSHFPHYIISIPLYVLTACLPTSCCFFSLHAFPFTSSILPSCLSEVPGHQPSDCLFTCPIGLSVWHFSTEDVVRKSLNAIKYV